MKHIAILDFGSQYTHLIARTVREMGVLAKIYQHDVSADELKGKVWGIILSGGPQSVYDEKSLKAKKEILQMELPLLGICYGHQFLAHELGGKVTAGAVGEYGMAKIKIINKSNIFEGISDNSQIWMSHGDSVTEVPAGFVVIGKTEDCEITAMANDEKNIFGFQFHPEVAHSKEGEKMLENFVIGICGARREWKIAEVAEELIEKIQKQVREKKVFILVSGGVDSNVAFALLTKALGEERVKGLYIDTGFMREDESERIMERFGRVGFHNLEIMDASEMFFERLAGIYEPEQKRAIIGQTFLDAKDLAAEKMGLISDEWLLGQGTIYPDTIESGGTKNSNTIKTHHNRVDAITKMIEKGLVVEPIVDLYKDEVRKVGKLLNLPAELVDRHPFPGPGLAIRCLCFEENKEKENNLEAIDEEVRKLCLCKNFEVSAKTLPIKSVGVQGDNRTYAHPLAIWGQSEWEKLDEIASTVANGNKAINRVILLLNGKKDEEPKFILPEKSLDLAKTRIDLLRRADRIVSEVMREKGVYLEIEQFPVVLVPICDENGKESIVLRPINTRDFMTLHFYRMEKDILAEIVERLEKLDGIGHIFFDLTNKPPGTTEWE